MAFYRNVIRGLWRSVQPIRNVQGKDRLTLPLLYFKYFRSWIQFRGLHGSAPFEELYPCLFDSDSKSQSGGGHYFYQDIWALNKLVAFNPREHHDVGSRLDGFVGQATAVCPVVYWDIRPPNFELPRFEFRRGSILNLPLPDQSVHSLSCLHVIEHIGLGRYSDALDPDGCLKALKELKRVLSRSGQLLLSVPIGRERINFNAHRVLHPERPLNVWSDLRLVEFSAVDDAGRFIQNASPSDFVTANFSCGLYSFTKD